MRHEDSGYWVVWCEDGAQPTVKHWNIEAAKTEAQRLARLHPGRRFAVLFSLMAFERRDLDQTIYTEGPF